MLYERVARKQWHLSGRESATPAKGKRRHCQLPPSQDTLHQSALTSLM